MAKKTSLKRGFTLLEMVISVSIGMVVLVPVAETIITCQRMMKLAMAETETSLGIRELREKLLFHAAPGAGSRSFPGLASAKSFSTEDGACIAGRFDDTVGTSYQIRIAPDPSGSGWRFDNSPSASYPGLTAGAAKKWLSIPGLAVAGSWAETLELAAADDAPASSRYYINLSLKTKDGITRYERIAVPVFDKEQTPYSPR